MTFLIALLVGTSAGWVATRLSPGDYGFALDAVVGIIGAILGGILFRYMGLDSLGFIIRLFGAALGAACSILGLRLLKSQYGL